MKGMINQRRKIKFVKINRGLPRFYSNVMIKVH